MKQSLTIALLLTLGLWVAAYSQQPIPLIHSTQFSIGVNHIDRNIRLDQSLQLGRHRLSLGAKYNLWWKPIDDSQLLLRERALALKPSQRFGLQAAYSFDFYTLPKGVVVFCFADLQWSTTGLWIYQHEYLGDFFVPRFQNVYPVYAQINGHTHNTNILEQNIGAGFRYPISKRLELIEMTGVGIAMASIKGFPNAGDQTLAREFIFPFLRVGLVYNWTTHHTELGK